jgi:hypothetical protein
MADSIRFPLPVFSTVFELKKEIEFQRTKRIAALFARV